MPLAERLADLEALVRSKPTQHEHRWALFELLCVMGQWTRAIVQLQVWGRLHPQQTALVQAYRDLIRAEHWRNRVLNGQERPGLVFDTPAWMEGLLEALRLAAAGETDAANDAREGALDAAPMVAGHHTLGTFEWITDSDSRLGPVFELITAGRYRWLPLSDLAAWDIATPSTLIDLVWAPCSLTLADGSALRGFAPVRYPQTEANAETGDHSDAICLGNQTIWRDAGRATVIAAGRKTWTTDAGDYGLFELNTCTVGTGAATRPSITGDGQ
ncbi:type VI secretion system accessory protein TagJ [Ralstonia sp. UBA689]|uniref:type VI secretion system accessory protein TagJ n=1 Tax=Ralstonia sp. UBA689 TaxID=1947373 RepID=UPI0025D8E41F|nr:type VI secretion system accessory protein TagJ [Ralstonia sp. UBA689]